MDVRSFMCGRPPVPASTHVWGADGPVVQRSEREESYLQLARVQPDVSAGAEAKLFYDPPRPQRQSNDCQLISPTPPMLGCMPPGDIDRQPQKIEALNLGQVKGAVERHLDPARMITVVAGTLPEAK
jgi:hypothetical protein